MKMILNIVRREDGSHLGENDMRWTDFTDCNAIIVCQQDFATTRQTDKTNGYEYPILNLVKMYACVLLLLFPLDMNRRLSPDFEFPKEVFGSLGNTTSVVTKQKPFLHFLQFNKLDKKWTKRKVFCPMQWRDACNELMKAVITQAKKKNGVFRLIPIRTCDCDKKIQVCCSHLTWAKSLVSILDWVQVAPILKCFDCPPLPLNSRVSPLLAQHTLSCLVMLHL